MTRGAASAMQHLCRSAVVKSPKAKAKELRLRNGHEHIAWRGVCSAYMHGPEACCNSATVGILKKLALTYSYTSCTISCIRSLSFQTGFIVATTSILSLSYHLPTEDPSLLPSLTSECLKMRLPELSKTHDVQRAIIWLPSSTTAG